MFVNFCCPVCFYFLADVVFILVRLFTGREIVLHHGLALREFSYFITCCWEVLLIVLSASISDCVSSELTIEILHYNVAEVFNRK